MARLSGVSRLFDVPLGVAYHVVSPLATWLGPLPGGLGTAAAIMVCTVAVRLLLLPLSYYAVRGERARARLLPQVQQLRTRYARQPERLRREITRLQHAEGAGLAAGCLPALLQLPFFSLMYRLFGSRDINGMPNALLGHHLAGAALASRWLTGAGPFSQQGVVFVCLFALLGAVAWASARMAARQGQPGHPGNKPGLPGAKPGGLVAALGRLVPYGTLLAAAIVPLAAGIYLVTTTTWTALERAALHRRLGAPRAG